MSNSRVLRLCSNSWSTYCGHMILKFFMHTICLSSAYILGLVNNHSLTIYVTNHYRLEWFFFSLKKNIWISLRNKLFNNKICLIQKLIPGLQLHRQYLRDKYTCNGKPQSSTLDERLVTPYLWQLIF